ncbi:hypothetical protein [Marinirhabdus gelatinilytica]|uniref:Uncharacterized protein n=1 Tax=Marinirhabdus gelatinilytica TaxID=1703343 RepID=A0A370QAV3_9FLAO|nr:hypothetical protein [Marinirhabdus gelatinilytica]RDK85496.1 hypothetical protein C8D94_103323 [Marinirhabdus gelatinilytica]
MKSLGIIVILLILTSCNFKEQKSELSYPLENIELKTISSEDTNRRISDTIILNRLEKAFRILSNNDLIKGKRLHGASSLCDLTITTNNGEILLMVSKSEEKEVVMSFYKFIDEDNFTYFLGTLYETDQLMEILKNAGIVCES